MNELLGASAYFGVFVSLLAYGIGTLLRKKWKLAMLNPILIAVVLIIVLLSVCHIDYTVYNEGAKYLSYLLTLKTRRRLVCYAYISQYITASCYHSLASGIVVSRRWLSWLIHANPKRTSTRKCRSALNRNSLSSLSHTANARSVPHRGSSARLFPSGLRNMIHDPFPMLPIPFYAF